MIKNVLQKNAILMKEIVKYVMDGVLLGSTLIKLVLSNATLQIVDLMEAIVQQNVQKVVKNLKLEMEFVTRNVE